MLPSPNIEGPIYISGPISGIPNFNKSAFDRACDCLNKLGIPYVCPWTLESTQLIIANENNYKKILSDCIEMMTMCNSIVMLNGWEGSNGARTEYAFAYATGMKIYYIYDIMALLDEEARD